MNRSVTLAIRADRGGRGGDRLERSGNEQCGTRWQRFSPAATACFERVIEP